MKDRLESFIENNRDSFDAYEPRERVWDGLKNRKKKVISVNKRKWTLYVSRIAAASLIFIASYAFHEFMENRNTTAGKQKDELYQSVPELKEAEIYYNTMVSQKLEELEPYFTSMPALKNDLNQDLTELDSTYSSLKKDLKDNIANDQVIEAMIQNYRMKLQILEDLLYEFKQDNTQRNENTKYNI
mgnify:CR=1 FL=1